MLKTLSRDEARPKQHDVVRKVWVSKKFKWLLSSKEMENPQAKAHGAQKSKDQNHSNICTARLRIGHFAAGTSLKRVEVMSKLT